MIRGATTRFGLEEELDSLVKGQTYYVAIRAYTKSGQESSFSREASGVAK